MQPRPTDGTRGGRFRRVRTPSIMQMEAAECGAAALGIILAYYGRHIPLAQLRAECGVSRDGSKASHIVAAARAHGLQAAGYRKHVTQLDDVARPCIVFWNYNHFLVVEGRSKDTVFVNDPATGRRSLPLREFARGYSGVVLVMAPGLNFRRSGRKSGFWPAVRTRLKGSAAALVMCMLVSLLLVVPGILYPGLLQIFIDRVLSQSAHEWAGPLLIGILASALLRGLLTQIQSNLLRRFQFRLSTTLSTQFLWRLLHLPPSYYDQRYAGELAGRIELNDVVGDVLSGRLTTAVIDIFLMVLYLAVMFRFDRPLSLMAVFFACLQFLLLWHFGKKRADGNHQLAYLAGRTAGTALAGLQAIRTIKASALESDFFERWSGHFGRWINRRQEVDRISHGLGFLPAVSSLALAGATLIVGGFRVLDGTLTLGQLVAFQALAASFLRPIGSLVSLGAVVQILETDLTRLDDVLENPTLPSPLSLTDAHCRWAGNYRLRGRVELRGVSFGYHPLGAPLIEDLSFTIEPGQRTALVGASGSGKSTVLRLVAGLYEPAAGEILFDGTPRSEIPHEVLTNSLAAVDQDIHLFQGSISENITLWDPTVSHESIVAASWDALIHECIVAAPRGYDNQLIEGAANLSGGQRQRLELARALVMNPSILILDEATSALDAATEERISENIRRRGCTCLIAAHRLSTVRDCDEIIVLDRGRVVERGRHQDLIRAGGEYARLLAAEAFAEIEA